MKLDKLVCEILKFKQEDIKKLESLVLNAKNIIMIGNGGSNSICSHISQDYTKQLAAKAFTFSDSSRLTCYMNDYGLEEAYRQFLQEFSIKGSLVILISSSSAVSITQPKITFASSPASS